MNVDAAESHHLLKFVTLRRCARGHIHWLCFFVSTLLSHSANVHFLTRVPHPSLPSSKATTRADRLDRTYPPADEGGDGTAVSACQPTVSGSLSSVTTGSTTHRCNGSRIESCECCAGHQHLSSCSQPPRILATWPHHSTRACQRLARLRVLGHRYPCLLSLYEGCGIQFHSPACPPSTHRCSHTLSRTHSQTHLTLTHCLASVSVARLQIS